MRYLPTTSSTVEALKKQAKKLQRKGGGKHTDLLDRVARGAGYDHWHHVMLCLKQGSADSTLTGLLDECRRITAAAHDGRDALIVTGPELLAQPLILFACLGDAWLLEPTELLVLCLRFAGEDHAPTIAVRGGRVEIAWDGEFSLDGQAFALDTEHPTVGVRTIHGYRLDELRKAIDEHQAPEARFADLFLQPDAEELTAATIDRLVNEGWERETLEQAAREGCRYSPSRNSLFTRPVTG